MSGVETLPVGLGLDPEEAQRRFDALQQKLVPLWKSIQAMNQDDRRSSSCRSMSLEDPNMPAPSCRPTRSAFCSSCCCCASPRAAHLRDVAAIFPSVIDYYLDLLPGVIPACEEAAVPVSPLDGSRGRSAKLLERPRLIEHIRSLIPDPDRAHLVPYNTTELERDLALRSASRCTAPTRALPARHEERLPAHLHGGRRSPSARREDLSTTAEIAAAIASCAPSGRMSQVIVKLNEGVSGEGNALLSLDGLSDGAAPRRIEERLHELQFELPEITYDSYTDMLEKRGGVVEERIVGEEFRSPSVQMRVTPLGKLEVLSTHDQLLGGPSGQSYLGCIFPADPGYATAITREAVKVGERLAAEGVIGRFALDFVAVRSADGELGAVRDRDQPPQGRHDPPVPHAAVPHRRRLPRGDGRVHGPERRAEVLRRLRPRESARLPRLDGRRPVRPRGAYRLHFDQSRQTGVVFHMMSALGEYGAPA